MDKSIVLCSGGLDSSVLAYYVKKILNYGEVKVLFFDYGQKTSKEEEKAAWFCSRKIGAKFYKINIRDRAFYNLIASQSKPKRLKREDLKDTKKESEKWYVPARNFILLSYAISIAEADYVRDKKKSEIFVGFKHEGKEFYPDTTQEFLDLLNKLNNKATYSHVKVKAPFIKHDKEDIIEIGNKLGVELEKTFSCYVGSRVHCGICLACMLRKEGFHWANIEDETSYMS